MSTTAILLTILLLVLGAFAIALVRHWLEVRRQRRRAQEKAVQTESVWADAVDSRLQR